MYPEGTQQLENYPLGRLEMILEGKYRPGHFQGVCQVVRRLLDIVQPDDLFMGQKDYQQCMVIRRLLEITGSAIRLHPCPIQREADGLAMSSRNVRLTQDERQKSTAIYRALTGIREGWQAGGAPASQAGDQEALLARARAILEESGFRIDYVEIADAATLESILDRKDGQEAVALIAAFQGEVRLIDNMLL
jgi:pantoate--beta-alanine ligase